MGSFGRTKFATAMVGVLLILLGGAILANPAGTTVLATRLMGLSCLAVGVASLLGIGMQGERDTGTGSLVLGGTLSAFGAIVALFPDTFVSFLFTMLGVWVLLTGVNDILRAGALRTVGVGGGRVSTAIGVVTILLGAFIIVSPFAAAAFVPTIAGIVLVADGVSELFLAIRM